MKLLFVIVMILLWKMRMAEETILMDNVDIISFPSDHITAFNGTVPVSTEGMHAFCEWKTYIPCDWINTTYINESRMICHLNKEEYTVFHAVVNCDSENMQLIQGTCNVKLYLATKRPLSWKPTKKWEKQEEPRYDQITRIWGDNFVVQIPSIRPSFVASYCRFNATKTMERVHEWMQPLMEVKRQLQYAYDQNPSLKQIWKVLSIPITDDAERSAAAYRIAVFALLLVVFATGIPLYILFFYFFPTAFFIFFLVGLLFVLDCDTAFHILKDILGSSPFGRIVMNHLPSQ